MAAVLWNGGSRWELAGVVTAEVFLRALLLPLSAAWRAAVSCACEGGRSALIAFVGWMRLARAPCARCGCVVLAMLSWSP